MSYDYGSDELDEPRGRFFARHPRYIIIALVWLIAMGGSAAGLYVVYRGTTKAPAAGEVPIIHADHQPTRKRPADPGGMAIPDQDKLVYSPGKPEPKVEQLLPPPEQPVPPPVVAAPPEPPPPPAAPAPVAAAPAAPPPPEPAATAAPPPPPVASTPAPPPQPVAAPAAAVAPAPVHPAPARPAPPPPSASGGGYRLQIGAVRTPEGAKHEWERLKRANGDVLGKLGFSTARVDLGERGVFYRIQAGPVADAALAERHCAELKRRGVGCILVKP